jgi:dihydropyrimidinase
LIDLAIKNGKIVESFGIYEGDIWVKNGKIVNLARRNSDVAAKKIVDAQGRYVLPGGIDSHSHIGQMPGPGQPRLFSREEYYKSESASALYGGITSVVNYIFSQESMGAVLPGLVRMAKEHSRVDMVYHGSLMNDLHLSEIDKYVELGLRSFKIFLPYKGEEALKLGGLSSLDDGQLLEAFSKLKQYNALPIVHAENPEMIDYYMGKFYDGSRHDMGIWEATRPAIVEGEAVAKVIYLAKKVGCKLCIAHVSSADATDLIVEAGDDVILETCPHYLALTTDSGLGSLGKVSPPIRKQQDQDKLWEAILSGRPVIMGSDHNPWRRENKQDLWEGLAGLPGNAYILPILFTEGVHKRGLRLEDVVRISSTESAKLFNLYPQKGTLQIGSDADAVIMDTGIKRLVDPDEIPSAVDYSPYKDVIFTAWPYKVIKSGVVQTF